MKHPILRVKKDSARDLEFLYDREERLARKSPPRGARMAGGFFRTFFRRGRFSFFPILVVVLAVFVLFRIFPRTSDHASFAGWDAVLAVIPHEDALLVSVSFARGPRGVTAPSASVRFQLPDTGAQAFVSETLSADHSTLRARMAYTGKEKRVVAEVKLGETAGTLSTGVKKP
jgi:hypothetical protein